MFSKIKKNAKHLFQSWENLISDGTFATPAEQEHDYESMKPVCFFFFWLKDKENLINSLVYCKKKEIRVYQCLYEKRYQSLTLSPVNFRRRGERWVKRNLVACVASVSVRFRSKERETRVKDRAKNGASERAGRGWGRKEGNAQTNP